MKVWHFAHRPVHPGAWRFAEGFFAVLILSSFPSGSKAFSGSLEFLFLKVSFSLFKVHLEIVVRYSSHFF